MTPEILVPPSILQPCLVPNVLITVTPVPKEEDPEQSLQADLYTLELQAYQAVKAQNVEGFIQALDAGMDSTHVFTAIPFDDVANDTLLQFIVKENFVIAVETLIFHHRRKNLSAAVMAAFMYAMRNNRTEIVRLFLKGVIHNRIYMKLSDAFRHAMYKSQYDLVAEIIQKPRFDVNLEATWGMDRPLHIVVQQSELVRLLLEQGAVVNCCDRKGATPLINACTYSALTSVYVLLQHGADPNHTSCEELYPYYSALHATYRFANQTDSAKHIIELLLRSGLNLHQECRWLQSATANSHISESVLLMLRQISAHTLPLRVLCCVTVKAAIRSNNGGRSILKALYSLPLPPALHRQLALEGALA